MLTRDYIVAVLLAGSLIVLSGGLGAGEGDDRPEASGQPAPIAPARDQVHVPTDVQTSAPQVTGDRVRSIEAMAVQWGPDGLHDVHAIAEAMDNIVSMHDALLMPLQSDREAEFIATRTARAAVEYFRAHGAVEYLLLGLDSPRPEICLSTTVALANLNPETLSDHRVSVVRRLVQYLDSWHLHMGSEDTTFSLLTMDAVTRLLILLLGEDVAPMDQPSNTTRPSLLVSLNMRDQVLQSAKLWLEAHGEQADTARPASSEADE